MCWSYDFRTAQKQKQKQAAHVHTDVMRLCCSPVVNEGRPYIDLDITRGVKVAHRLFLCVQDAWHREEAVDVGDDAETQPKLATMLTVS
jgi:hypothetical protein